MCIRDRKRSFDILVSFVGLVLLSPVLLVVAIGVKCSSPGPVIYQPVSYTHLDVYKRQIGYLPKRLNAVHIKGMFMSGGLLPAINLSAARKSYIG